MKNILFLRTEWKQDASHHLNKFSKTNNSCRDAEFSWNRLVWITVTLRSYNYPPWGLCFACMINSSCSKWWELFSTQTDNERRTFSQHKGSSQQRYNCFSYGKFAFTFSQLMKLNQNILPTIGGAVDLNVSGSWISSFNLSKHPGERGCMAWIDWQSSITRAYQTPVCNYPGSVWQWDLICAGIIVTKMCVERGTAPHRDPSIIFISMFSLANTKQHSVPAPAFVSIFLEWKVSVDCFFFTGLLKSNLIFIFDIWFMVCCLYATFGCESQTCTARVVSKQQPMSRVGCSQQRHSSQIKQHT